jgi:DNA-binding Lrp family transcriptional regulator
MAPGDRDASGFSSSRLDDRVLTTLQGLGGRIAFSGLRRVLGAHPESLSRALRRLEREGLVEHADGGYRSLDLGRRPEPGGSEVRLRAVASVEVPPGAGLDTVLARLTGRWFGELRWVGIVERPEGRLLAWALRDGSETVLLGVRRGVLRVYLPERPAPGDLGDGEDAAYQLLVHAVEALRPLATSSGGSVRLLRAAGPVGTGDFVDN